MTWRQLRLWRHGPGFQDHKDRWAAVATLILALIVLTYVFASSMTTVLLVALISVIAIPALAVVFFDRSRRF